ncbi:MAG: hypothetical protein ACREGA_02940 [Candidatus Saccharimonadales bacterium]
MQDSIWAIIIAPEGLLVINHRHGNDDYYRLIGGDIQPGADKQAALNLMVSQQTNLVATGAWHIFTEKDSSSSDSKYIYLVNFDRANYQLKITDQTMLRANETGQELFKLGWLPIDQINQVNWHSDALKEALVMGFAKGWPDENPVEIRPGKPLTYVEEELAELAAENQSNQPQPQNLAATDTAGSPELNVAPSSTTDSGTSISQPGQAMSGELQIHQDKPPETTPNNNNSDTAV